MSITHVIFDCDGTLVNSVDRAVEVVDGIIRQANPDLSITDRIRDHLPNVVTLEGFVKFINSELGLNLDPPTYAKVISDEARKDVKLLPGVEKLLKHLQSHGIPMAVATGGSLAQYNYCVSHLPPFFTSCISHVVCGDDPQLTHRKPHPQSFLLAASRFTDPLSPEVDMSKVLIFEDSLTGLQSAVDSGGQTVFVSKWNSMFTEEWRSYREKAALVISTLEEFKPEQFGLPPYKD